VGNLMGACTGFARNAMDNQTYFIRTVAVAPGIGHGPTDHWIRTNA
jgi:hypothetical protein